MFGFFWGGGDKCSVFFKMWLLESMSFVSLLICPAINHLPYSLSALDLKGIVVGRPLTNWGNPVIFLG